MGDTDEELGLDAGGETSEALFLRAAEWMRNAKSLKLSNDQKLSLYGLFKQASGGPCNTSKPGIFDMAGRAKWEAWHKLGAMESVEAMSQYIQLVDSLAPAWREAPPSEGGAGGGGEEEGDGGRGKGGGAGPVFSTLMTQDDKVPEESKDVFDWCKEGNVSKLKSELSESNVNSLDEQGMSLLHWACDRGHLAVVQWLVDKGAQVNQQDRDLQTPLHYAASCGHGDIVRYLTSVPSIDKHMCDCDGMRPLEATSDPQIRELLA